MVEMSVAEAVMGTVATELTNTNSMDSMTEDIERELSKLDSLEDHENNTASSAPSPQNGDYSKPENVNQAESSSISTPRNEEAYPHKQTEAEPSNDESDKTKESEEKQTEVEEMKSSSGAEVPDNKVIKSATGVLSESEKDEVMEGQQKASEKTKEMEEKEATKDASQEENAMEVQEKDSSMEVQEGDASEPVKAMEVQKEVDVSASQPKQTAVSDEAKEVEQIMEDVKNLIESAEDKDSKCISDDKEASLLTENKSSQDQEPTTESESSESSSSSVRNSTDEEDKSEGDSEKENTEVQNQEIMDYEEPLQELNRISQVGKHLCDDEHGAESPAKSVLEGGRKRSTSSVDEPVEKKAKLDLTEDQKSKLNEEDKLKIEQLVEKKFEDVKECKKNTRRIIKRLTREELEDLLTRSIVENLSGKSEIGQLRRKCEINEAKAEKWQKTAQLLQKQTQDLTAVMRRYITETRDKKTDKVVAPVKVTRSVGLQVNTNTVAVVTDNRQVKNTSPQTTAKPAAPAPPPKSPFNVNRAIVNTPVRGIPTNRLQNQQVKLPNHPVQAVNGIIQRTQLNGNSVTITAKNGITIQNNVKKLSPAPAAAPAPTTQANNDVIDLADSDDEDAAKPKSNTYVINNGVASHQVKKVFQFNPSHQQAAPRMVVRNGPNNVYIQRPQTGGMMIQNVSRHPAPLPQSVQNPNNPGWKLLPPKPSLKISRLKTGIVLSWNMDFLPAIHEEISSYQIYAYQEGSQPPSASLWKKVGDVKALPLPMACTLTQFQSGHKYHFAVRARDKNSRMGQFSDAQTISLN